MRLILLFLFAFYCAPMVGQESLDSTPIDTIVVSENNALSSLRPEPSYSWSYIPALPSAMGSRPVDDLLNQSTAQLFVKNYGAGSLSSLTSKGLAAEHQEIEWNGLQINSAMNGIIDLKLLPTIMSDKISWHESGDFTAGSKLSLSNRVPKELGVETELNIEAGSFGQRSTHVSVANNFPRLYLRMQLMAHVAENDFNFTNIALANDPVQKLEHARTNGSGAQVSARYKIKRRKYLDFNGWYQQNERQIPRTMLQTESVAEQDDRQWRQVLSWKNDRWTASSGWQWEEILFRDEKINIDAENRAHTWSHKLKYRSFELPGREYDKYYFLESEISHIYSLGKADNYGDNRVDQSKTAIRFRLQKVKRKKNGTVTGCKWNAVQP